MEIIITIIGSAIAAILSSLITAHLALRRFRAEKWWEIRVDSYRRLIESLHVYKKFAETLLDKEFAEQKKLSGEYDELVVQCRNALQEIDLAADSAGFLLSKEALTKLKTFQTKREESRENIGDDWDDFFDQNWVASDSCLQDIIEIARRDLGIDRKFKWF